MTGPPRSLHERAFDRRVVAALALAYLSSRLLGLTVLPMFLDESWHINWSMWIAEGKEWEVPWQYGKGLNIFVNALLFPWVGSGYLWGARFVTVAFGALTLACVFLASRSLFDRGTAIVAAIFQIFCPYALFYDRLVLTDPVQSAFAAASLLLSVRVAQGGKRKDAILLGLALALSVFAKALGVLVFLIPAAGWLLVSVDRRARTGPFAIAYAIGVALVAYPLYAFFTTTSTVRAAIDKSDAGPVGRAIENAPLAWGWIASYWTWPLLALALGGLAWSITARDRRFLLLGCIVLLPLLAFLAISTLWFPRYLVFLTPPLVMLAAASLVGATRAAGSRLGVNGGRMAQAAALFTLLTLAPALRFDYFLWTNPTRAPFADVERFQFVDGWPSGYGVRDTLDFIRDEMQEHKGGLRVVLNARSRRTTAFALGVAFRDEGFLVVDDLRLEEPAAIPVLQALSKEMPTLLVVSPTRREHQRPDPATFAHLGRLVAETRKPDGSLCDQIYRLFP